ncbi:MAG: CDP-alcohol phosphatidyltransferase family protein [Alphaproteobacteria bacterium]|nr:CDP-alcohol phosphatidyltransferase family protein [Alphaproteobacteria bacterium]
MSHNTFLHRMVRPLVRPLAKTAVTPNQVTTLRLAFGLAAAASLASADVSTREFGAALFLASMLLDRADGELARQSGKSSPGGHRYDLLVDSFCDAIAFFALGMGLRGGTFGALAPAMGAAAGVAIAAILLIVMRVETAKGARAGEIKLTPGFDPDDALLILPLAVWLGWSEAMIAAAAIGVPAFALGMAAHFRAPLFGR